jgi:DNA-directed RNA polymerase subunit L
MENFMKYIFKGSLCGYICDDCTEHLSGIEILLYLPRQQSNVVAAAVAATKETFHLVDKEEAAARKDLLIARAKTDELGNFEIELDEKYRDTAFELDVYCGNVPRTPPKPPRRDPIQLHLTTIYPRWHFTQDQSHALFRWDYCIDAKWWCFIRGYYFDAWTICGRLLNCENGVPIAGAEVTAWDADLLTDDNLGSATTDANGHFRIDYTSIQFKQTFLSPWINVETDPGLPLTFQSGPDVYFVAKLGTTEIYTETKADARKNVGYCLCVRLCSKIIPNSGSDLPSQWTGIGLQFNIPTGPVLNDFDAEGFAGAEKFGFTGMVRLTGQAPHKLSNGHRVEYRFLVSHATTPNGGPAPALANFTKIVGVDAGLFASTLVAKVVRNSFPFPLHNVISHQSDFDANGWFDLTHAIERTLTDNSVPAADFVNWGLIDEDALVGLNTAALTSEPNVPTAAAVAGAPVPLINRIAMEKIAIRFEIREVIDKSTNIFAPIAGTGKTLNSMAVNNNPTFMKCVVNELETLGSCSPLQNIIHTAYTVHHPLLRAAQIRVRNNSNTVNKLLNDGFITLSGNTNSAVNHHNNPSLQINANPNDLVRCTYELRMSVLRRLHNGDSSVTWEEISILFFYEV